jgi:hypothetical protein
VFQVELVDRGVIDEFLFTEPLDGAALGSNVAQSVPR